MSPQDIVLIGMIILVVIIIAVFGVKANNAKDLCESEGYKYIEEISEDYIVCYKKEWNGVEFEESYVEIPNERWRLTQ